VTFSGSATNIATNGITFNTVNFICLSHSTKTLFGDLNVDGNLFVLVPSYRCNIAASDTSTIYLAGDFSLGSYNETFGQSGTLNLVINGDSNQTLSMGPSTSFKANLTVAKSAEQALLGSNFTVSNPGVTTINSDNTFNLMGYTLTNYSLINNGTIIP